MKNITVKDIIKITKGNLIIGKEDVECISFSKDTRTINENDTYIGIKGEKFNGNDYWQEALDKGAICVIVENIDFNNEDLEKYQNKVIIKVENTHEALYKIAEYKRSLYDIPVIAITGSVGKTSTKDIIANVVSQKFKTLKTIGNNNNNIGMPFTILNLKDEEAMVLEMGMNHFGEIELLSKIAKPNICVITNIGTSHIGNLGSRENILKAKLEILKCAINPIVIVNNDNDLLHNWYENNKEKYNILTYGIENLSDINAVNIKLEKEYSIFNCKRCEKEKLIKVPVAGEHFILNALSAILVGKSLNIDDEKIKVGIEKFELTKKRTDIIKLNNGVQIINATYNASPESMQASLKDLSKFKENRKIAVLGDMLELGDFSEELHRKVGEEVYKNKIDILLCYGENSIKMIEETQRLGMKKENTHYFQKKEDILEYLKNNMKSGDVILFKASNGMKFYELVENLIKSE